MRPSTATRLPQRRDRLTYVVVGQLLGRQEQELQVRRQVASSASRCCSASPPSLDPPGCGLLALLVQPGGLVGLQGQQRRHHQGRPVAHAGTW